METKLVLPAALLVSLATPGCFQGEEAAFDSSDLADGSLPASVSTHEPVVVKLLDDTLLCVTQTQYDLKFFKTADGYAEKGYDGSIKFQKLELGGAVDYTKANLYYEITPLEALALVDYDWRMIYEPIAQQAGSDSMSVDPEMAGHLLEWSATGSSKNTAPDRTESLPNWYRSMAMRVMGLGYVASTENAWSLELDQVTPSSERVPVFVRMPNNLLLRISQENLEESDSGKVRFHKTSSGYGVKGVRGSLIVVGAGYEEPVGGVYTEISPKEVRAYFDGDVSKVIERTSIQYEFMRFSVNPEIVRMVLAPELQVRRPTQSQNREKRAASTEVAVQASKDSTGADFEFFESYFRELEQKGKVQYPDDWADYDRSARERFIRARVMADIPAVPITRKSQ